VVTRLLALNAERTGVNAGAERSAAYSQATGNTDYAQSAVIEEIAAHEDT